MTSQEAMPIIDRLKLIQGQARQYFEEAAFSADPPEQHPSRDRDYWEELPEQLKERGLAIVRDLANLARVTGPAIQRSPLLTEADQREAGRSFKGMRAALRFRLFEYWDPYLLHDEDIVLGVRPGGETDERRLDPAKARERFEVWGDWLYGRLELMDPRLAEGSEVTLTATKPIAAGYRPGTAFVMMWMAKDKPELVDVSNTVKRCFAEFGITAVRSDDIEHEDVITQRILDEIKTAEFLFADLTGERPSVYYEAGYAHALGRRVILFRKAGTPIHFDLAAYDCPEYHNLTELEGMLMKRLEHVTGKVPKKTATTPVQKSRPA
jgi:hypothetical protein